jgi:hypothetical protein
LGLGEAEDIQLDAEAVAPGVSVRCSCSGNKAVEEEKKEISENVLNVVPR